jgi:3-oxoacyl-[acyl-carrier-protein] synthase-1
MAANESKRREIVITGAGICTHLGHDMTTIAADLRAGKATPFGKWEPAVEYGCRCQLLGLYPHEISASELGVDKQQARFMGRAAFMVLRAARTALEEAKLDSRDIAVIAGSGTGDVDTHLNIRSKLEATQNAKRISPTVIPRIMASTVSANLSNVLGTTGPSFSATAACAGGAYNILLAGELIANGHVDAAIAGGVEVADLHFHSGFDSMRAYNGQDNDHPERASRPYAADRAGFIFAEGAGIVVLETRESAERRAAPILGVLRGYGMSSDGRHEMVAPAEEGAELAIRRALKHAHLEPDSIDYVNTHGTSTPVGDVSEINAMRRVFGDRHVAYSSTKGYTGHTVSAAGAVEAVLTLTMLNEGWIAPSVNAEPLDPALEDYPPVLHSTDRSMQIALSNSFGFGGTNVTLVLGKAME